MQICDYCYPVYGENPFLIGEKKATIEGEDG